MNHDAGKLPQNLCDAPMIENAGKWLDALATQLRSREFDNLVRYTHYFPQTGENRLLRLVALLGAEQFEDADKAIESLAISPGELYSKIHRWIDDAGIDLERLAKVYWPRVALFGMEGWAARANESIPSLIACAAIAVASGSRLPAAMIFGRGLIKMITSRLPSGDVDNIMRVAKVVSHVPAGHRQAVVLLKRVLRTDPDRLPDTIAILIAHSAERAPSKAAKTLLEAEGLLRYRVCSAEALCRSVLLLLNTSVENPQRHLQGLKGRISQDLAIDILRAALRRKAHGLGVIELVISVADIQILDGELVSRLAHNDPSEQLVILTQYGHALRGHGLITIEPQVLVRELLWKLAPHEAGYAVRRLISLPGGGELDALQEEIIMFILNKEMLPRQELYVLEGARPRLPPSIQRHVQVLLERIRQDDELGNAHHEPAHMRRPASKASKSARAIKFGEGDEGDERAQIVRPDNSQQSNRRIDRHTSIELPRECELMKPVLLIVQLTRSVARASRSDQKISIIAPEQCAEILIEVIVTAPGFAARCWEQMLRMPADGDSNRTEFTLVPLEAGLQIVEIEFFHDNARVGYVIVNSVIRSRIGAGGPRADIITVEEPSANLPLTPVSSAKKRLHVTWCKRENRLRFLLQESSGDDLLELADAELQPRTEDYLRELNAFLVDAVPRGKPSEDEWQSILMNFRGIGSHLQRCLVPEAVAAVVANWDSGTSLVLSTNEQWIPWELMYDGKGFWGTRFALSRLPRFAGKAEDAFIHRSRPTVTTERAYRQVINVIGGNVDDESARRARRLFASMNAVRANVLDRQPLAALERVLPGADVLHLTCHGLMDPHLLQIARDASQSLNLLPQSVAFLSLEPGCFVFANACASTAPAITFGEYGSFGWEFYRRGASAFVGTLGPVPTLHAIHFAEIFYGHLLNGGTSSACSVGEALAASRREAETRKNIFWLLYCVYGNPDARLAVNQPSRSEESK